MLSTSINQIKNKKEKPAEPISPPPPDLRPPTAAVGLESVREGAARDGERGRVRVEREREGAAPDEEGGRESGGRVRVKIWLYNRVQ